MERLFGLALPRHRAPGTVSRPLSDGAPAPTTTSPATARLRLLLVGLGISVVPLDTSVNIAFPDITGSFGLPIPMIQWVVICYVLTNAGPLLAFGRVGDLWSHARVFRAGLAWSVGAFLLCSAAPSFGWLLFFRFLQGIGAALIVSCAPAIVTGLYPEAKRAQALGTFTLIYALASAVGPLLGGVLVARWGWPAVFWFRAPIALTSLLFLRGLPAQRRAGRDERFDLVGALLLAAGLAGLLLAINALARLGDGDDLGLLVLPIAVAILLFFVWWEGRAAQPIVRIELFRHAGFAVINLAGVLMYLVTFSVMLIGPYFIKPRLISLYGNAWGGSLAGLVLGSGFVAMSLASPLAGWLVPRIGAQRIAPLGALLTAAGLSLVGSWHMRASPLAMILALALQGAGTGFFQVAYMEIVMAASPAAHRGVAGSLAMLTRTVGVVFGASGLMLGFQSLQAAARAGGQTAPVAFMTGFHGIFHLAGAAAVVVAAMIAWSARRRRASPGV